MHIKWHLIRFINMPTRLLCMAVQIVYRVLVKGTRVVALEDVLQTWGVRQPEDAVSKTVSSLSQSYRCSSHQRTKAQTWGRKQWQCSPAS